MFDLDEDIQAGWNVFCDPTDYDVKSLNSSTIMAEGNWWGSTRSILGNVDYTYQAEEIAAIFQKAVALSEEERLFKEAYELERSGDYQEAASSYLSLIEKSSNKDDITYVQKSMNRIRGCYRKLNAYSDLEKVLSNLSDKYPDTYVSAMAKNMNAPQLSLKKDFTHALNNLDDAVDEFIDLNMSEAAAYSLFDKYELLEYLSEREDNLNKSALSLELNKCEERLLDEFKGTEASEIMKEVLNNHMNNDIDLPADYSLGSPYPNPFNPVVNIPYDLPEETQIQINIFDISGKKVQTLVNRKQSPGRYNINFNASHLASGMYIVRINCPNYCEARKMLLLK